MINFSNRAKKFCFDFEGAIFDMDGTLLDSMAMWATFASDFLRSKGITPEQNLDKKIEVFTVEQVAAYFAKNYLKTEQITDIILDINKSVLTYYEQKSTLKPGVAKFLQALYDHNIRMCVATATPKKLAYSALKRNNILHFFPASSGGIISCSDIGINKDSTEFYTTTLQKLCTPRVKTIVFEDVLHAVKSAKKAGFKVIAIYDESSSKNEKKIKNLADKYIYSFNDLLK